jgi:hypothetical protein
LLAGADRFILSGKHFAGNNIICNPPLPRLRRVFNYYGSRILGIRIREREVTPGGRIKYSIGVQRFKDALQAAEVFFITGFYGEL